MTLRPAGARRRAALSLLLALALLMPAAAGTTQPVVKSTRLLLELMPGSPLSEWGWAGGAVTRETVVFPTRLGERQGDLFRPAEGRHTAAVLVPGLELDPGSPAVRRVLGAIARSGLAVLVPRPGALGTARDDPGGVAVDLVTGGIDLDQEETLVSAFQHVRAQEYVRDGRAGFIGFSVGASLAAIAAADVRIRHEVAFLHLFGGYHNAAATIAALVSHEMDLDGRVAPWKPRVWATDRMGRALIAMSTDDGEEQAILVGVLSGEPPEPGVVEALSPGGRRVYDLLTAGSYVEARRALGGFPEPVLEALERVSPSTYASGILAPTFILHDAGDRFIPPGESRRLWASLPEGSRAGYTEVALFEHVELQRAPDAGTLLREAPGLIGHLAGFLATAG